MATKILSHDETLKRLETKKAPYQENYYAMYSSWLGGITKDPIFMTVPVDDHMVHRGDGVFEAFKAKERKIYLLESHLDRLQNSAAAIGLELPYSIKEIRLKIIDSLVASERNQALVRLFVSRGPGSFTTNPYESVGSQLYIVITKLNEPSAELFENGARAGLSHVPTKDAQWASIKCCNYLPNVMMKKEAVDRKLHFTVSLDEHGNLGEGSTENIAVVDQNDNFVFPPFDRTLKGTTLRRVAELAESLKAEGLIKEIKQEHIQKSQSFKEFMFVGTTLDVLPVSELEGQKFGKPGPVAKRLRELLVEDMKSNEALTDEY